LRWGRPTAFFAVPRVWEKLELTLREQMLHFSDDERKLGEWAMAHGKAHVLALEAKTKGPSLYGVASSLFLRKMKASIGLDQSESFYFGAAALKQQTSDFFTSLDIPLFNLYGLSETTGCHVLHNLNKFNLKTSGFSMPGTQTKIDNPDKDGDGEILLRGRQTMMGYLNNEKATVAALTSDGFLRTGDKGRLNPEGFLQITGRIKELIITAGGENIAPVGVEDKFKLLCPPCSNIMLVGEGQRFLAALITFKVDMDPKTGLPTRNLMLEARQFFQKELGLSVSTSDQAIAEPKVQAFIEQCVVETNKRAISRAANIRKF
jgi:long-chain-fatty-acid--CoA ligase ACSBG